MSDTTSRNPAAPVPPDENSIPPAFDPADAGGVVSPPTTFSGTLQQLGPGLIIAGSIVGSGELIATTKTGSQAGITLLWLIIVGCLIKVFVQIELGRITITHGETTLATLNRVPGKIGPANWILWFWLAMMSASIAQLGGIVGGVGQALALSFPISGDYVSAIQMPAAKQLDEFLAWDEPLLTAWDLRLASAEENGSSETESTNPLIAPLERRVDTWLTEQRQATSAALNRLPSNERDSLFDAYAKAFPTSPNQTPAELEANRDELRLRLRELNSDRFEAEIASRQQAGALPAELNERQRRRLERGHEILAEELTLVSIQRSWRDVARALVAQRDASAASRELKSIAEDDPLRPLADVEARHAAEQVNALTEPWTWDDKWWAAVVTFLTIGLLANGRYGIIQNLSTVLVVLFTFLTVGNAISLQTTEQWSLSASTLLRGLSFGLPESGAGLKMALATFGIIGVGATELITYPYWCIEKGYARYTGWRSDDPSWAERARGWMRVMHWDAFISMIVYTVATVAFYLLGAAVLFSEGRDPDGMRMVGTLAAAYVPVFGEYAKYLFLVGAIAVLYSTFLVANAGHARMFTDGLKVFGLMDRNSQKLHNRAITFFCVLLPFTCLAIFWSGINPVTAVAFAGMMQATMLPMIGFAALYCRWTATDPRLAPPRWWDVMLVLSFVGLFVVGVYGVYSKLFG